MDHLITKSDLSAALQGIELRLGKIERQQLQDRQHLLDHDEQWRALSPIDQRRLAGLLDYEGIANGYA